MGLAIVFVSSQGNDMSVYMVAANDIHQGSYDGQALDEATTCSLATMSTGRHPLYVGPYLVKFVAIPMQFEGLGCQVSVVQVHLEAHGT